MKRGYQKDPQASWIVGPEGQTPPWANAPQVIPHIDYSDSQVPSSVDYLYFDPDYPIEMYAS
jgi:hypothetical protein